MKEGWEIKKLGEVCTITMGQSPSSDTYNDSEGLPFFQGNADFGKIYPSIRVYCNAPIRIAEINDILISVRAPIGAINIANCKCCIGRGLASIRKGDTVIDEFIYHSLLANREKLIAQGTGSTFKSIGRDILKNLPIPIPPLPTQERIVSELDCINSIIEKKREQLKELDALAQSIFYDMFGDPIHNEKGWEVRKLGELSNYKLSYGSGASAIPFDGNIRYVRITDINDSGKLNEEKVSPNVMDEKYLLNDGDLLFARSGATVGKTYLYNPSDGRAIYAGYLIRFIPNTEYLLPSYIFGYTKTEFYKSFIQKSAQAVAQPNINAQQYSSLDVLLPPLSLQQSFASKIEAIEKQKELIKRSIAETETLLASRMQYYFG